MPLMEGGQDGRHGDNLYSQIHGQHSEKSSGAKTPKTPSLREATPNYIEMYTSGRSSREKTPSVRNASGETTPNIYDHRLVSSSGRSSKEKQPREIEQRAPLNESTQIVERRRTTYKRERSNEPIRVYGDGKEGENDMYQETQIFGARHGIRLPIRISDPHPDSQRVSTLPRRNRLPQLSQFHRQGKQGRIMQDDVESEEDDSESSMFKDEWNSSPPGVKTDMISSSQVSVVQRYVQDQAKALAKYNHGSKENINHDEWDSDVKKPKSTKNLTDQKTIAAVLAFQRWRHTKLKKLFSMELQNVLEEAKEDEACLAQLEKELATKDKHLAQLRAQVAQYEQESHDQINQRQMHELLGANVQELEKECHKALERASLAEDVLRKRDAENVRLRERLGSLDKEGVRLDSELQTNLKLLQNEKESALDEGRILLAQLTRRDEEVAHQCKEIEKLRASLAKTYDRQTAQQKQVDEMKASHHAQVQNLEDKLQEAFAAKHAQEMELASFTERYNGLGQERQNLLAQLQRAVERADLASRHAEELQVKLHCTSEERAKASEDVATEMVEHLKRLTGHMKELETSVDQNGLMCWQSSALQKKAGLAKISTKLAQAELDTLNLISHGEGCEDDQDRETSLTEVEAIKRQVCLSLDRKNRRRPERSSSVLTSIKEDAGDKACNMTLIDRGIALTKLKNWTAWKWRWAAAATRAESLLKQLQDQHNIQESKIFRGNEGRIFHREGSPLRGQKMGMVKKLESSQLADLNSVDGDKVSAFILKHKLVPLMMCAWRAFARMSGLERKAISRNQSLNKIISALPWWIRRVGERRLMERYFFHWQLLTLKATRERSNKRKVVPYMNRVSQTKGRDRELDPSHAQTPNPRAPAPTPTLVIRDAEVQTSDTLLSQVFEMDGNYREPIYGAMEEERRQKAPNHRALEVDGRQRTPTRGALDVEGRHKTPILGAVSPFKASSTPRFSHQVKTEPKTVQCPTCEIRKKYSSRGLQQQHPHGRVDSKIGSVNGSTFATRALRALQGSLQQELKELQYLLSQEMEDMQQLSVNSNNHGDEGGCAKINRQALKSVFEVCNNLAHALVEVRTQLDCPENLRGNTPRGSHSPPPPPVTPRVLRTRYLDARDTSEGGGRGNGGPSSLPKDKFSLGRQSDSGDMRTPHYASPIGQGKGATRFSSPGWRSQEESTMNIREPWSGLGSPTKASQLRECKAKIHAPSTIRELRELRARQDRQRHAYENNYPTRSGQKSPHDRDGAHGESTGLGPPRQLRRGDNVVRFSEDDAKAAERDDFEDQQAMCAPNKSPKLPPPPDYTTVVQILNQENTKIGEVAIHTSAVATTDRGGVADLCSSARDATRTEEQNNKTLRQLEAQKQHQEHFQVLQQPRTPQELAGVPIYKSPQPNYRPKSSLKLPIRGQSVPRERSRSHHVLRRPANLNPRLDDAYFLSLRRKQCIGSDYADLLKSEIVRLREGRLMLEDCKTIDQGEGDAMPSRELTPRHSSFLAIRPSWRPHYTATTSSSKKRAILL